MIKKCVVCGHNSVNMGQMGEIPQDAAKQAISALNVYWMMENMQLEVDFDNNWYTVDEMPANRPDLVEYTIMYGMHPVPYCCELCWIALINNNTQYMWNGKYLLVYDEKEEEYIEKRGSVWRPSKVVQIQFEWDKNSQKWVVMPKRRI